MRLFYHSKQKNQPLFCYTNYNLSGSPIFPPSMREVAFSKENDGGSLLIIWLLPQSRIRSTAPSGRERADTCRGRRLGVPLLGYLYTCYGLSGTPAPTNSLDYIYNRNAVPTFCTLRFAFCTSPINPNLFV